MAPEQDIPANVRTLVVQLIDSVVQLEALLLLHADPQRAWAPEDMAKELRIEAAGAQDQLTILASRGLVGIVDPDTGTYHYGPSSPELAEAVNGLAKAYADRRVTIIGLIYSQPATDTLRSFADAFRFRKDPTDG